jgi:hypothetical protein
VDANALVAVTSGAAAAIAGSLLFFRRSRVDVPPIGVFGLDDAIAIGVFVTVMPFVYLALPYWLVVSLFALGGASVLQLAFSAMLPRPAVWSLVAALTAAEFAALARFGSGSDIFLTLNDCVLIVIVAGLANLWAQSGMRVRDAVVLGGGVAVYDYLATLKHSLTIDLMDRLAGVAFAPRLAFSVHGATTLSVGLGDLLFASVFPLLLRRAYGRRAAIVSALTGFAALAAMTAVAAAGLAPVLPAMVVLWPLMLIQYAWWRRQGPERTTWAYLAAEPRRLDFTRV